MPSATAAGWPGGEPGPGSRDPAAQRCYLFSAREKELDRDAFLELARSIKPVCRRYNVPFLINDDVEVALACDADGVHVGQE